MKKISKILLVLALLCIALAITACDGSDATLSVKENGMPQLVHVLGEELDLSNGVLVFSEKGSETEIAMNAEGVEATGYDKTKLGEQTVTVKYKGKETTVKVTVVPRMTLEDVTDEYLVGDNFDTSKGNLKITRNDGTTFTVVLKSDKVQITGFDSSKEGTVNLKAKYTNGANVYECDFSAKIYKVEAVTFVEPNRLSYNSHDGVLDVTGGEFVLTGNGGKVKSVIPLKAENVKGFDISAANEANTPYTQTLTAELGEMSFKYEVKIIYTNISKFKDGASLVKDYVWEGEEEPTIPETVGKKAIELMSEYFDMSPAEQSLLTRAEVLNMARVAMIYGYTAWHHDMEQFEGAFGFNESGQFEFSCESRAAIESAIEKLEDTDRPVYTLYTILNSMITTFEEEILFTYTGDVSGDALFGNYTVIDPELYPECIGIFEYMLELDTLMDAVGADWNDDINKYSEQIEAVYNSIVGSEYYSYDYAQFFIHVSLWRKLNGGEDDAFDFLYKYYFDVKEDTEAVMLIANLRLPSKLEEIFVYMYNAEMQLTYIANYYVADTTQFFYNYFMAVDLANELVTSTAKEDEMLQVLFYALPINSMLGISAEDGLYTFVDRLDYLCNAEGGYYALCGALLGNPRAESLFDQYLYIIKTLFDSYDDDGINTYKDTEEYISDIKTMFNLYMALSPVEQFMFLGTLNAFYAMNIPPLAFDTESEYSELISIFNDMINEVYLGMFESDAAKEAYYSLILATELYAQRYTNADWLNGGYLKNQDGSFALDEDGEKIWVDGFKDKMNIIAAALTGTGMSDDEKNLFNTNFSDIYNGYKKILSSYTDTEGDEPAEPSLGEWADEFEALKEAVTYVEIGYYAISSSRYMYNIFFSAFERAQKLYDYIYTEGGDEIRYILIHSDLYPSGTMGAEPGEDTTYWSYDYVLSIYRSIYTNALLTLDSGYSVYDLYMDKLAGFMEMSYDLYWSGDKDKMLDIMAAFRELDVETQIFFLVYFNSDEDFSYYTAIESAFEDMGYSEKVRTAASELLNLEMVVVIYEYYVALYGDSDEVDMTEIIDELNSAYTSFNDAYDALGDDEAQFLDDFGAIYEYYKVIVEGALETANA